ncbi:MAG TPA: MFS transporter [Candidatus Dormibacteraeota bacterium]|nr:MFS transporter [Candidatus Dormibacteraeota bacterium]
MSTEAGAVGAIAAEGVAADSIQPNRTLALLVVAHAVNHAQAVILPLVFLKVIEEFGVGVQAIAFLAAAGNIGSGMVQLTFAALTRIVSRRALLGWGGILFGGGFAAQALANGFGTFSLANIASRIGGAPQHPVGNGLLAEQYAPERRGFAISAHIAGGNVGTVFVAVAGAFLIATFGWRGTSVLLGVPAILVALLVLRLVRESGADRAAAIASGSVRHSFATVLRDRDIRWIYLTSILGGGGRGLGVANLFALLYLTRVIRLDDATSGLMYGVLIVLSVPMPLVAGWLSDRIGRRSTIVGVYVGGAVGFAIFVLAGSSLPGLWLGIAVMGLFSFAESPQLQALLADIATPAIRDSAFSAYFTLAFGVGSLWTALYGTIIDALGEAQGLPLVFGLMAASFVLAALAMLPVREPPIHHAGSIEVEAGAVP